MTTIKLPYPPSVNTYWRNFRGHTVLSKAGRDFKTAVAECVIAQNIPKFKNKRLEVTLWLYPRSKVVTDLDNRLKAVLDGLEDAGVYDNDGQIDVLMIQRGEIRKGGGVDVMIEVL
jgi:crossover junction endodeoxyribonuclease RusA